MKPLVFLLSPCSSLEKSFLSGLVVDYGANTGAKQKMQTLYQLCWALGQAIGGDGEVLQQVFTGFALGVFGILPANILCLKQSNPVP
jgi:hypothetical protein